MKWFRLYHSIIEDPLMLHFNHNERWFWIEMLCLASQSEERGFVNLSIPVIAKKLRRKSQEVSKLIAKFVQISNNFASNSAQIRSDFVSNSTLFRIISESKIQILEWEKYQFGSDDVTERTRKHREKRNVSGTFTGTPTDPDPDTDTDTEYVLPTLDPKNIHCTHIQEKICVKKEKNKIIYPEEFEEFWKIYPRSVNKKGSLMCWNTIMKDKVLPDTIIMAAKNYAVITQNTEMKHILYPSTFLGPQKRYEDFVDLEKARNLFSREKRNIYMEAAQKTPDEILGDFAQTWEKIKKEG